MKYNLMAILAIFSFTLFAQNGIHFESGTLAEVMQKAQDQKKPVFVDVYTTWCGPCKRLSAETFTDSAVGAYFNEHFINYKLDAEKGEGRGFAAQYRVGSYPTVLFIKPEDGQELKKLIGFRPPEPFLDETKTLLDPSHQPLIAQRYMQDMAYRRELDEKRRQQNQLSKYLQQDSILNNLFDRYQRGQRDAELLADFSIKREQYQLRDQALLAEYFTVSKGQIPAQLKHLALWSLKADFILDPLYDDLIAKGITLKIKDWSTLEGKMMIQNLNQALQNSLTSLIQNGNQAGLTNVKKKQAALLQLQGKSALEIERQGTLVDLAFARGLKDAQQYFTIADQAFRQSYAPANTYPAQEQKVMAYELATMTEDLLSLPATPEMLERILAWTERGIILYNHPDLYAAKAQVQLRLKKSNEAMETVRAGMTLGKAQNLSTSKLFNVLAENKNN